MQVRQLGVCVLCTVGFGCGASGPGLGNSANEAESDSVTASFFDGESESGDPDEGTTGRSDGATEDTNTDKTVIEPFAAVSPVEQVAYAGSTAKPPVVRVTSSGGEPIAGVLVEFVATGEGATLGLEEVWTDDDGVASAARWTMGRLTGTYRVIAKTPELDLPNIEFVSRVDTDFQLDLVFVAPVSDDVQEAFARARRRWEGIILNALVPVQADLRTVAEMCGFDIDDDSAAAGDVTIFVQVTEIDGRYGVLGQAGPCVLRGTDGSPFAGRMRFDSADFEALEERGLLEDVILHEMGHVLGLGTLWQQEDLLRNPSLPDQEGADTHFIGEGAKAAFEAILGGVSYTGGEPVPVHNDANQGAADGHWRESLFAHELMTPRITGNEEQRPLSQVTLASLGDLPYYDVNLDAADPYQVPFGFTNLAWGSANTEEDVDPECLLEFPSATVTNEGIITVLD